MEKQIGKAHKSDKFTLSDANMYDVLAQRNKTGESLTIYMGEDGALYSDKGQYLWRVVERKEFNVPDGVVVICDRAFFKCHSIRRISLPKSLRVIENGAFRDIVHPISAEGRRQIEDMIIDAYHRAVLEAEIDEEAYNKF